MKTNITKVLVTEFDQNGFRCFVGSATADVIGKCTTIDRHDPNKKPDAPDQGYQRPAELTRVKAFANFLRKNDHFVLPPVLLSSRELDLHYNPASREIELREDQKLQIVDGQHRLEGFKYALEVKGLDNYAKYPIPFMIISNLKKIDEMNIFRVVNGEAKPVRMDLVNILLTQLNKVEGKDAVDEKDQWKVVTTYVADKLNRDANSPWFDKIVSPGASNYTKQEMEDNPSLIHRRLARMTSFTTSLKPVYNYFAGVSLLGGRSLEREGEKLAKYIDNFWRAIQAEAPEMFESGNNFVIQKTVGIFSLHRLLPTLLKNLINTGCTVEDFRAELSYLPSVTDPNYWSTAEGEAAKYGSMKGFKQLTDLLIEEYEDSRS